MRSLCFAYTSLLNIAGFGFLFAAYWAGWLIPLFRDDNTYVVYGIVALFLVGLIDCWIKSWRLSRWEAIPLAVHHGVDKNTLLKERFDHMMSLPYWLSTEVAMLGMIGTFVGIIIAASHLDPSLLNDAASATPAMAEFLKETIASFGKSMVGASLALWLAADLYILNSRAFDIRNSEVAA